MKKRRSIIALFLAVAILAIGVGYAKLTDTLQITANVMAPNFDSQIKFTAAALDNCTNEGGNDITATVEIGQHSVAGDNDAVTISNVKGLDHDGDILIVKCTITSISPVAVTVTPSLTTELNNATFKAIVTDTLAKAQAMTACTDPFDLSAGDSTPQTKDVWVAIKLNAVPDSDTPGTFVVNFAVAEQ